MFKKVLVPLDGTPVSEAVLKFVAKLAQQMEWSLVAMTAHQGAGPEMAHGLDASSREGARAGKRLPSAEGGGANEAAYAYLKEAAERAAKGVSVERVVASGRPADEITRTAERAGCDLIALGAHSRGDGESQLGGVAHKVLYSAPVPLLLFHPAWLEAHKGDGRFETLLAPLDGSDFGASTLPYVETLAKALDAEVALMRAYENVQPTYLADPMAGATGLAYTEVDLKGEVTQYLEGIAQELKGEGLKVTTRAVKGAAARSIAACADDLERALVVMSTHGHSSLARWLMGSVTEATVRSCRAPVLVVPRQYGRRYATEVTELLSRAPLFAQLTERDLESLSGAARIHRYREGEAIVTEGDTSGGLYVVVSGAAQAVKGEGGETPKVVGTFGPGDFFGEMSIVDDAPRSATVRATEDAECVAIRRSDFQEELKKRPEIAVAMLPELVRRLREARQGQQDAA